MSTPFAGQHTDDQAEELPALKDRYEVSAETVAGFQRDGHTAVIGLASTAEVEAFRSPIAQAAADNNLEQRALAERGTYGQAFLQTTNLWLVDEAVRRFVLAPRFAGVAAALMGVEQVRLYHDQALFKEAGGGRTPWHQDQFYWPFTDPRTITMWMPLVDLEPAVGSMRFATGSHRLGAVSEQPISDESEHEIDAIISERGLAVNTHGALRAGDATFHAGWTLHSAGANPSSQPREVMTVIYMADGIEVATPANPFQDFDRISWLDATPPGQPAAGSLNPLITVPSG